jgi:hypothetical protein
MMRFRHDAFLIRLGQQFQRQSSAAGAGHQGIGGPVRGAM